MDWLESLAAAANVFLGTGRIFWMSRTTSFGSSAAAMCPLVALTIGTTFSAWTLFDASFKAPYTLKQNVEMELKIWIKWKTWLRQSSTNQLDRFRWLLSSCLCAKIDLLSKRRYFQIQSLACLQIKCTLIAGDSQRIDGLGHHSHLLFHVLNLVFQFFAPWISICEFILLLIQLCHELCQIIFVGLDGSVVDTRLLQLWFVVTFEAVTFSFDDCLRKGGNASQIILLVVDSVKQ